MDFDPAYWQPKPRGTAAILLLPRSKPRYFEDFAVGETFETASHTLSLEEVVAFAEAHDPQYFHVDAERARAHPVFQGISASGFQTMTVTHRLILALEIGHAWGLIGKGLDDLRWRKPVRPGDTLRARGRIVRCEADGVHPFGIVATEVQTLNQRDETVMSFTVNGVVPLRRAVPRAA
jgi:acyl dehydratase